MLGRYTQPAILSLERTEFQCKGWALEIQERALSHISLSRLAAAPKGMEQKVGVKTPTRIVYYCWVPPNLLTYFPTRNDCKSYQYEWWKEVMQDDICYKQKSTIHIITNNHSAQNHLEGF